MTTSKKVTSEMEANRCAISARDCDEARQYLEAHLGLGEKGDGSGIAEFFTHREGLLLAAIVAYSRAFIDSHGGQFAAKMVGVDLGTVFCNDISKINLHKTILERRHNAVAHATWKYNRTEVLEALEDTGVLRQHAVVDYGKDINPEMFRDMAETMRDHFQHGVLDQDVATKAKLRKEAKR